ncbi:ribonucleoside-diphosphate reductase alpha chain/ribonucleoside-triphosphate reductase [Natranaerovirga hydrolytica]|uniref:Adenosylcobalamin-dependent ribonucleoside-triphosphate reductase n=1 Tax=Natranaerovirga hydrolytica TaxID=680378 RepID=A0A4R1MDN3_9FIRM|nr:ribonucleoside-triphosphate reductase, adenosylcobalamin-dependent [Natranaerovirga hydrolytica]TCK87963.1 ribonucleoside-diphosphate reductase alpha chain/ribonucleoside-triphosphate reductase [Natranaerovirga hydrolytica]
MLKVIKRNGNVVDFDQQKIITAIKLSMAETKDGVDASLAQEVYKRIEKDLLSKEEDITVEFIQDVVEKHLMDSPRKDAAKRFILYRYERDKNRDSRTKRIDGRLLSDEFVSKYKHKANPMKQLGNFVYYRTYSRWLSEENRREYWWETVRRAVEYNCSLVPTTKSEAEKLYDNIFNLKQFLSGRTFWVGGTDVANFYPMANYNCSFQVIDNFNAFKDLFYLLMIGSGVGVRILKSDVNKLPKIRTDFTLINEDYTPIPKNQREDSTSIHFSNNNTVKITIGDSKEGWVQSLDYFFKILYSNEYRNITTLIINYNHVRPKGEKLKTFGGTASGHSSLKNMFIKISSIIKKRGLLNDSQYIKLQPIDCLDFSNLIGENVVVGGVRRTAEIILVDPDDKEAIEAKSNLYKQIDGQWIVDTDIIHRQMSNNSIYYTEKPSREQLRWQLEQMRYSGEPGWVNEVAGAKRRPNMNGVNPCGEILLDSKGLCNLTTINVMSFVKEDNTLDYKALYEAQRLSARAGYRMTCVNLEIPEWDYVQKRDKLIGCSLTGWQDLVNALNLSTNEQKDLLKKLREVAKEESKNYANEIGENEPLLVTTVKPEGTLSQLPTVSSGVHYSHSPYYIRRVRINANDPLVKVCEELDYPIFPEVGQDMETCTTKVIEFPIKAPEGKTKYDVSAIEQLENYKLFMENYVDHNCSITVHVRDHEWEEVEKWVWNHWDDIVAVSFLSLDDNFYQLLPYESITKEEYDKRVKEMKPFLPNLITKYEKANHQLDVGDDACENGVCPVR